MSPLLFVAVWLPTVHPRSPPGSGVLGLGGASGEAFERHEQVMPDDLFL